MFAYETGRTGPQLLPSPRLRWGGDGGGGRILSKSNTCVVTLPRPSQSAGDQSTALFIAPTPDPSPPLRGGRGTQPPRTGLLRLLHQRAFRFRQRHKRLVCRDCGAEFVIVPFPLGVRRLLDLLEI